MPKVIQAAEFFVVGGPVQPDRLCYVERAADRACAAALAARKYCHVLGPRAIGKSSLMGRFARSLRQQGELAACVDLAQIDARGESDDADRWAYSIAHKVAHELRLNVDLPTWWQETNALGREHRLADFFWEIVLTNTTTPVTVFIDDIEQAFALPFAQELLAAIGECRARRKTERDFGRLSFVLLGVASVDQLAAAAGRSPFADAAAIQLGDFTREESYRLAMGLGGEQTQAHALMDRIGVWTNGHPYFTQKVARGVARKGGKLEDVERVVREQLLTPAALQDEPPLSHARATLAARSPAARQALKLLRRVARGAKAAPPRDPAVFDVLLLSGVAVSGDSGALRYRNRIFKEQLGTRWLKAVAPRGLRTWAAVAALVAAAAIGGYWYTQYLPLPYIRTLSAADAAPDAAAEAYRQLHRLPGFAARAERLLGEALVRRSGTAATLAAALDTDTRLRQLPGQEARANALLAEFWLRKAELAAQTEQRDAALLLALRGAATDPANREALALAAQLTGDDYRALERTVRLPDTPVYWSVDWPRATLLTIDAEQMLRRWPLVGASTAPIDRGVPLTALQPSSLTRELRVDGEGSAGSFQLTLAVRHPASRELQVTLAAPSGAQVILALPQGSADRPEDYVFSAAEGSPLAALADQDQRGRWRLSIVDRRVDNLGVLFDWGLRFGEDVWSDDPAQPIDIPEPSRTTAVTVTPAAGFAIVRPATPGAAGTVALWNLVEGRLHNDFALPTAPEQVELNAMATRMLAAAASSVTLWNVADGTAVARLATQTEFVLPPVFSADGAYFAIAERVEGSPPLYSLLSAVDGALLASIEGVAGDLWVLGPGGRYVAVLAPRTVVRVLDPRRGMELARLTHGADVRRLLPLPDGTTLITIDAQGDIRAWSLVSGEGVPRLLGTTPDATGVSVSADGTRLAYATGAGTVEIRDVQTGARLEGLRLPRSSPPTSALSADGAQVVTAAGAAFRFWTLNGVQLAGADVRADVAAIGVDRDADLVAVGFRAGQLTARAGGRLDLAPGDLDFFGHAGVVTSVAVNSARGVVASGGADGTARVWDVATGAPAGVALRHAAAVSAVALSADGRWLASAGGDSARIWSVADGTLVSDIASSGRATAVAFSPAGDRVAHGDDKGRVVLAAVSGAGARVSASGGASVTSVAFAPDASVVASGDTAGNVRLWRSEDGQPIGAPLVLPQPVQWLDFDAAGTVLVVATDYWLHSFAVHAEGLERLHSRLAALQLHPAGFAAAGGERVRLAGLDARGALRAGVVDLASRSSEATGAAPPERDWPLALGLRLDDAGEAVSTDL